MKVYQAINRVQAALAVEGISKDRNNQQQGYKFRGIDDVYNALAPQLAKHGLCVLPRIIQRECVERVNAKGTALFYVTVHAEFDFVCAEDGSKHTVTTYGEAMDSGDKATNKAMSAAYKYACMQAFSIPTEGDNDADATTHEVKPRAVIKATDGAEAALTPDRRAEMDEMCAYLIECHQTGKDLEAARLYYEIEDNDSKVYVWQQLGAFSKLRASIKANSPHKVAA
jgi:hypothetical protein